MSEWLDLRQVSAYLAIVSALGMSILGLTAFTGGRSRARGSLVFGLFALVWGVQIMTANFATLAGSAQRADLLYVAQTGLLLPLPFLLVSFVASQTMNRPKRSSWWIAQVALLAIAAIVIMLMYLDMTQLYRGSLYFENAFVPLWGPWTAPLVALPFFAAFILAIVGLRRIEENAPTPRVARRANILGMGIGLYVSYAGGIYLLFFGQAAIVGQRLEDVLFALVFLAVSVASLTIGVRSLMSEAAERTRRVRTSLVYILPWFAGVGEGLLIMGPFPQLHTVGLWRLGAVAIIVLGLANWRTYDLPQRAARGTATTAGVTGSMAGGVATFSVAASFAFPLPVAIGMGTVFAAASVAPLVRFARRLIPQRFQLHGSAVSEALYGQKIDAFRAAVEASLARGTFDADQGFLAALKERFGISDDEERLLLHLANNSVLVPNKDDPDTVFEKLRLLGEGGSGRTWLVRDRVRERLVVLKEPLERWQTEPSLRERVLREARLAAKVRHPNVVRIEQVIEAKGSPSIVMEHVDGGTLRDLLREEGVLPWRQAVAIMGDILDGLEAVHATGIVHRDIKPSNILMTSEGTAKISDFGIAIPATSTRTLIDPMDAMAGTRAYMAPETLLGRSTGTRQSDVYSCAVVLYECLYGAPPAPHAVVFAQKDIPEGLIAAVERGLASDPKGRHGSVRVFAEALRRVTGP